MPLIQLIQEQTGAKLSYNLDYQAVTILNKVLKCIFCSCSYTWTVPTIRGVFHLDTFFISWFRIIKVLLCFWSLQS